MEIDLRPWGQYADFMCHHPHHCARPKYARATICWFPRLGRLIEGNNFRGKFGRFLNWLLPVLFGARGVQCLTCHALVLQSGFAKFILKTIRFFLDPEGEWKEHILVVGEDVDAHGEGFAEELGFRPSKD